MSRGWVLLLCLAGCDYPAFLPFPALTAPDGGSPKGDPCHLELSGPVDLGTRDPISVATPLDEAHALLATFSSTPTFFRAGLTGVSTIAVDFPRGAIPGSGTTRGDRLWIADTQGRMWSSQADQLSFTQASTTSAGEPIRWLSASPPDRPLEIFALGDIDALGRFYRFTPEAGWRVLWSRTIDLGDWERSFGGVAWAAEGEAFAIPRQAKCNHTARCVLHARISGANAAVVEEPYPLDDPASALTVAPGVGPVAGTVLGSMIGYDGARWEELGQPLYMRMFSLSKVLLPVERGFLFISERNAGRWRAGLGACPDLVGLGIRPDVVLAATAIEGGVVIAGTPANGYPNSVLMLRVP